jgi:hypothetical protein
MHDRHSFFGHAVAFLLAFAGDDDRASDEPSRSFVARVARFVTSGRNPHASELVGVVAGVLVDAGAAREIG